MVSSGHHEAVLRSLGPPQGGSRFQLSGHRVKGEAFCSGTYNKSDMKEKQAKGAVLKN